MGVSDLHCICGKGPKDFVTLRQFKIHFKKHEGPVNCPVCTKEFASIIRLQAHQRTHKNETFNCDQCDKSFSRIDNLKKQKESHNMEKIRLIWTIGRGLKYMYTSLFGDDLAYY